MHLEDTDKFVAVFTMLCVGTNMPNFGGLLFLTCKWSVLSVMEFEWPKPIVTIIDEEKKLHDTCRYWEDVHQKSQTVS